MSILKLYNYIANKSARTIWLAIEPILITRYLSRQVKEIIQAVMKSSCWNSSRNSLSFFEILATRCRLLGVGYSAYSHASIYW